MSQVLSDIELLERLVAFDTTSHRSNLALADFLCEYVDGAGVRIARNLSADGNKTNLVIALGPEVDETRAGLCLSGHTDVVPAAVGEWESDPFELTDRGETLAARGSCDMKGFLALATNLLREACGRDLRSPLVLLYTFDEEVGTLGAKHFVETWPAEDLLPQRTIIGEPTCMRVIRRHKGHLKLHLELSGKSAHSGYPHLGESAIEPAARAVLALSELGRTLRDERPPGGENFPEVPFVPLNIGRVQGGVAINVVPDSCRVEMGIRHLPGMDSAELVGRVEEVLASTLGESAYQLDLVGESPPLDAHGEAASELSSCLVALSGNSEDSGASYATDAGWLQSLGMECVLFGPGSIKVAHKPNEFVPRGELAAARTAVEGAIQRYC